MTPKDRDREGRHLRSRPHGPAIGIALLVVFGVCVALISSAIGQDHGPPCDPSLRGPPGHPYPYRNRGDRCEGVYARPVASTTLSVVSLTAAFDDYKLESPASLATKWAAPVPGAPYPVACGATPGADEPIHLRAQSLQPRIYYRMDAVRSLADRGYDWPKEMLGALAISRPGLGVLAWMTRAVDGAERTVYLPLRIAQQPGTSQSVVADYRVDIVPGRELAEVYVTLARFDVAGQPASWLKRGEALGYGYYPAERPIRIPLPLSGSPGCYRLEITATLRGDGGTTATALWLYDAWP